MASDNEIEQELTAVASDIANYKNSRSEYKSRITIYIKQLKKLKSEDKLSDSIFFKQKTEIDKFISLIKDLNNSILLKFEELNYSQGEIEIELEKQIEYFVNIDVELDNFSSFKLETPTQINHDSSFQSVNTEKLFEKLSKCTFAEQTLPKLDCEIFSGKETDPFAFASFLNRFNNLIGFKNDITEAVKLQYLCSYVKGYAYSIISHLSIINSNYSVALKLLKDEFLDVKFITDEIFKIIINYKLDAGYDKDFAYLKTFINKLRSLV